MNILLPGTPISNDVDIEKEAHSRTQSRTSINSEKANSSENYGDKISLNSLLQSSSRLPSRSSNYNEKSGSILSLQSKKHENAENSGITNVMQSQSSLNSRSVSSTKSVSSASRSSLSSGSTRSSNDSFGDRNAVAQRLVLGSDSISTEWKKIFKLDCLEEKDKKYLCVSCNEILHYPIKLSDCNHNVCSTCLTDLIKTSRLCPVDKKKIVRDKVSVDHAFENKLNCLSTTCPFADIGCLWTGPFKTFAEHYKVCEYLEQDCPNQCGMSVKRKQMKTHVNCECVKRFVPCRFCNRAVNVEMEIDHLKMCPRFPLTCPKQCGLKQIPREEIQFHIQEDCPNGEAKCPFYKMGCSYTDIKIKLEEHLKENLEKHVTLMCETLGSNLERLSKHDIAIEKHESTLEESSKKLSVLNRIYGCQMLWKIDEWSKRKLDAENGKKTILRSPPFYTGKYQYKLALSLVPNGDGAAKSRYMSLYVAVCRGEYDALVEWPFRMTITLSLVDQCQNPAAAKDHIFVLKPNPCAENSPFLGRPDNGANLSFGAQNFVLKDTLSTRDYVRDDVIFIRVRVEDEY